MNIKYFPGLDGLRFIAAMLVLISHGYQSWIKLGLCDPIHWTVIIDRGGDAVNFFFTLSGFLITYLLIQEVCKTGTVSLHSFYLRRVRRIWPLYYVVLGIGLLLFAVLYPRVYHHNYFDFSVKRGILLYVVFLPNLMSTSHRVGLLFPLWSIGVEEQFYLTWAPLIKLCRNRLLWAILAVAVAATSFQGLVATRWLTSDLQSVKFLSTLRFHFMAIGAFFAWLFHYRSDWYRRSALSSLKVQAVTLFVLGYYYVIGLPQGPVPVLQDVLFACLYSLLILNVSVADRRLLNLDWGPLAYLGKVSYGVYMFHMIVDYGLRSAVLHLGLQEKSVGLCLAYTGVLAVITISFAHLSYRYIESRILGRPSAQLAAAARA